MKVLFGHHGMRGDLFLNLAAMRYLHESWGWELDIPIHKKFQDLVPLFLNQSYVNSVVITDEYEKFPGAGDNSILKSRGYDRVFNPMSPHRLDNWWQYTHQTSSVLYDYLAMSLPDNFRQLELYRWFEPVSFTHPVVTIAPFAGFYSPENPKRLSVARAQDIVDYLIEEKGVYVYQIGGQDEPMLNRVMIKSPLDYFDSLRYVLGSKLLIHTDTGMGWAASAYKHPSLGLYSNQYYTKEYIKNIQPINPNSFYLDSDNVNNIPMDDIRRAIDKILN